MPSLADLIILGALLLALGIGIARGLIAPLFSEGAFLVSWFAVTHVPLSLESLPVPIRIGIAGVAIFLVAILVRMLAGPVVLFLERLPVIREANSVAGAIVHTLLIFVVLYVSLGVLLDFDRDVYPMLAGGVATARQIADLRHEVQKHPVLKASVDDSKLAQEQQKAGSGSVPFDALTKAEGFLDFYVHQVRQPLLESRLAPILNRIGAGLPVVGKQRPYFAGAEAK